MKLQSLLIASVFTAIAGLSGTAYAEADGHDSATEMKQDMKDMHEKQGEKKMRRHSHAEEKHGIANSVSPTVPEEESADKAKEKAKKHSHPRDAK